ncbi:hypothetical protein LDENG_00183040 [Lucifuga dentata]|nr:hypothetical protein LDENG_00183040 [Lucifuga dentata]
MSSNKRNPKVLFDTINSIVSPISPQLPIFSNDDCNKFLKYFVDKVANIRDNILPPSSHLSTDSDSLATLNCFSPVLLKDITNLINKIKLSSSSSDIIPTSMFLDVFNPIGPYVVLMINLSLLIGSVPSYFKHATVELLLKKN